MKWDGEHRCFRTDGENEFLAIIANVGASVGGSNKKEQDKSCDLSCLVEQAIEISNSFIDDYRLVCEFQFA